MAGLFSRAMEFASSAYEYGANTATTLATQVQDQVQAAKEQTTVGAAVAAAAGQKAPAGGKASTGSTEAQKKKGEEEKEPEADDEHFGRLEFSLDYDFDKGVLTVTIIQAENLPAMDIGGTSDPYVKLYIMPDKKKKYETKKHKKTLNPVFNESFSFPKVPYNEASSRTLIMAVFDHDAVGADDQMGEVQVPLGSLDLASDNLKFWREIKEPPKNVLGDICFSLRYVGKKSQLTCMIIECKNLKAMDVLTGASDPYVKMNLMQGGKRVKKQKTSVKMKNVNPYYNESFKFEVKAMDIQRSELHIYVMDFDRVGSNDAIGWVKLSIAEQTSAGKHWRDMIQSNGRSIAQWHPLQAVEEEEKK